MGDALLRLIRETEPAACRSENQVGVAISLGFIVVTVAGAKNEAPIPGRVPHVRLSVHGPKKTGRSPSQRNQVNRHSAPNELVATSKSCTIKSRTQRSPMKYNTLGPTGLLVSEICLGTMTFALGEGMWKPISGVEQSLADQLLKRSFEA